jgi:hypothetical protein
VICTRLLALNNKKNRKKKSYVVLHFCLHDQFLYHNSRK